MALPLLVLLACGDDPAPALDEGPTLARTEVPRLEVREPVRATFLGDVDRVDVGGEVARGSGRIVALTVNGHYVDVPAEGGAFSDAIPVAPGIAILGSRVETDDEERAVDGRAVMVGPVHEPGERLAGTVKVQLGPELLDDDDPDVDDVATLAETMLSDPALARSFVGMTQTTDYYELVVTDADFGAADVDVVPESGALALSLTVADVDVDFTAEGNDWWSGWYSADGTATATAAVVDVTLAVSTEDGAIVVSPTSTTVTLQGFALTVSNFPDSLEDELAAWTKEDLEAEMAAQVQAQVGDLVGEYLGAFSVDQEMAGMRVRMELASARVATWGVGLGMDAWVSGPSNFPLPQGAGSLATDGAGPAFPLADAAPFALAADDDFLNQLLFHVWAAGSLTGIHFGATEMTALAGEIPAPLGPVSEVNVRLDLPAVVGDATWADQQFDLALGELRLAVTREDGVVTDASINVRTGGTLSITDAGELAFALDNRPAYMTLEVGIERAPDKLDPGDMAALVRLSVPPLLGTLGLFLPAFPVPSVPLDTFGDAFAGQELRIAEPAVRFDEGWLLLEGSLTAE